MKKLLMTDKETQLAFEEYKKVIVKKIGQGRPFFWSVIPNWVTSPKRDKIFHKGSLEED